MHPSLSSPPRPDGSVPPEIYQFVAPLAKGGMGYVELCVRREGSFARWVARKRLHPPLRRDTTFLAMFTDEARLAGLVRHPNVVSVLDLGEDADGPYLIMDYVAGVPVARLIRNAARVARVIPIQIAMRICKEAADGVHAAHELRSDDGIPLNLVHRDVSPQNILIGFDGSVRVTDFGIAKALGNLSETSTGILKGNMGYVSPEQLRFEVLDRRSDIFSLGVNLFELLSSRRLYPPGNGDRGRRILTEPPPDIRSSRPDVPVDLADLLSSMLAKAPARRPRTALEVSTRLDEILSRTVANDGVRTIAEYMSREFADAARCHRKLLSEHLAKESTGRREPRSTALVGRSRGTADTRIENRLRTRRKSAPLAFAIITLAAFVCVAGSWTIRRTTRRAAPIEPSPPPTVALPPHAEQAVPLVPPLSPTLPAPVSARDLVALHPPASLPAKGTSHRPDKRRSRHSPRVSLQHPMPDPAANNEFPIYGEWR
ncbi:MAG TPA: protein kinase [Polyangia bacterium]|nr:protein kinase [Polyangia bacterium]